ncbi:acetyl-CoA carboxylase biotin carboxylase subunit [Sphaerisporangium krabiense]|uniref:Biotin carboxylase n=1 Tax=Sphaerisporangium krabiense TaxID=763782 RepID=A0A7W9DNQ8_9ACTN|nr:acetyl-CoA carboxylase biotin carboxylase subunit [Sphaerisporangium krabiense]MBB5625628.1 acetyl-CoA carboxylase biotin carboxylase subunit [Sphaerisporangium krabiense]GII63038.1 acetyl-CoA carboxylase biotin carboxylase subunit [Sphaerisporangium krabiense]
MFRKVLVANRGEIALRVLRACKELGIRTVAVYSTADADSLPVRLADESVCIGPPASRLSYLNVPNIIGAALKTGADAIHPGYGFLSEDPYFAEICADNGITFVGPPPEVMEHLGDKSTARKLMQDAGLPLLPGTVSPIVSAEEALALADEIGYPVVLKASAGGGGRGITVVQRREDLPEAVRATRANAQALFKDAAIYLEKYLTGARHIEVQVMADDYGTVVHLGERDCSVQRRKQKLIEESPSAVVDAGLRARIGQAAVDGARSVGYRGAGTMEFLLDGEGRFWFMEMNARIQVEHPVTEMVTGVDLVREQLRVAAGEPMSLRQETIDLRGHAIECRINAENAAAGFAPTPGRLDRFDVPGGPWVRLDTHCLTGTRVPPYYDSLIAKLIVWGPDRDAALDRMARALDEFQIEGRGVHTTIELHRRVLEHPEFRAGSVTTQFLDQYLSGNGTPP